MRDLGYSVLCLESSDVDRAATFYETLGFMSTGFNTPGQSRTVVQDRNQLSFLGFYEFRNVNLRGANIPRLAAELALEGFEIRTDMEWHPDEKEFRHRIPEGSEERVRMIRERFPDASECGAFVILDPDGFDLFFNTNPGERGPYEQTNSNPLFVDAKGWPPGFSAERIPASLPFGELTVILDVLETRRSVDFYTRLGFSMAGEEANGTKLTYGMNGRRMGPSYLIREADTKDLRFGFASSDLGGLIEGLSSRGVGVETDSDFPAFADADGNRIELWSATDT